MNKSDQIGELATALAKAQGAMRPAQKDRDNPFFKSTYATFAAVVEAIREPFSTNGLSFSQPTDIGADGRLVVETILMHGPSGQWISGKASGSPVKNDPQGVGSLMSYLKRYGLQAMAGVASADDDAEHAMGRGRVEAASDHYDPKDLEMRRRFYEYMERRGVPKELRGALEKAMTGKTQQDFEEIYKGLSANA